MRTDAVMTDSVAPADVRTPQDRALVDIATFTRALFEPTDIIAIRPIELWDENGRKQSRVDFSWARCLKQPHLERVFYSLLLASERENTNLFFGVSPRFGKDKYDLAAQIRVVRSLWCDIDHATVEEVLERIKSAGLPIPTATVHSGNGVHVYYRLEAPNLIDDAGDPPPDVNRQHSLPLSPKALRLQKLVGGLSALIGGDHTTDLSRLLRLPGSMNRKNARNGQAPVPCTLVECDASRRYSVDLFEALAPAHEVMRKPSRTGGVKSKIRRAASGSAGNLETLIAASANAAVGSRSEADFAVCCAAIRQGVDPEALWNRVAMIGKFNERGRPYFDRTWDKAEKSADRPTTGYEIGGVRLVPQSTHTTSRKVTVSLVIQVEGRAIDCVRLSDAASGRKAAAKQIAQHMSQPTADILLQLDKLLGEILVTAQQPAEDDDAEDVPTVYEVLQACVPEQVRFVYRTAMGRAFSEVLGLELSRQAFIERSLTTALLHAASAASDVPRDEAGVVNRSALIAVVERELKILWGDLTYGLPTQENAAIGPTSTAGTEFRSSVVRVWTKPASMTLNKHAVPQECGGESSVQLANRASLATRVADAIRRLDPQSEGLSDQRWKEVQKGYAAWYRREVVDGEVKIHLAMRWELTRQIGVELAGVHDQASLSKLGNKFGVLDPSPRVSVCIGGHQRIVVLSQELTAELLFDPTLDDTSLDDTSLPELSSASFAGGTNWSTAAANDRLTDAQPSAYEITRQVGEDADLGTEDC
jgi:hypothetical protein